MPYHHVVVLRGIFDIVAIIIGPISALIGVRLTQRASERSSALHERGETERLLEQLRAERASRQLDALRVKRRDDVAALQGWLTRRQAALDAQYLALSQIVTPPNPSLTAHMLSLLDPPLVNPAHRGLDVVLIPIASPELRTEMRALDRWATTVQDMVPPIREWLNSHPFPWDENLSAEWWSTCRPFLDATEDRDARFGELATLMEAYELGLDLD